MTTATAPKKILVIKLGAFGDFIQALGPMAAIRAHHKDAHITLMTTKPFAGFAQECGYFDAVLIDEKPKIFDLKGWMNLCLTLNHAGVDRVYDLQNNDRTAFYLKLFSIKNKPEWVGAAKGASHRNASKKRTAGLAFDGHVQTLALAGIENIKIDTLEWMTADLSTFNIKPPFVLLVPGGAPDRPEKRWPSEHYARLSKILALLGYQSVIIGTQHEAMAAQDILIQNPAALDLTGKTQFRHIATLARKAERAIGNDTGPMHLIAATSCPSLVLFSGASDPARHAPQGARVEILRAENLRDLKPETVAEKFKAWPIMPQSAVTRH